MVILYVYNCSCGREGGREGEKRGKGGRDIFIIACLVNTN